MKSLEEIKRILDENRVGRRSLTFKKRASVAIILVPFEEDEYRVLLIRRPGQDVNIVKKDRWAGHIAFPGGKAEEDESDYQVAVREVEEELGHEWDLDESKKFGYLGRLDDRDVKAPASSKTVMILNAFVFVLLCADDIPAFDLSSGEVYSVYLLPISYLASMSTQWEAVYFDISSHLIPSLSQSSLLRKSLSYLVGGINFYGIPVLEEYVVASSSPDSGGKQAPKPHKLFPLWGLSLWMTSDLLMAICDVSIADRGAPVYSAWDIELGIRLCHGLRAKRLHSFLERLYLAIGLRTNLAIRIVAGLAIAGRLGMGYMAVSYLYRFLTRRSAVR